MVLKEVVGILVCFILVLFEAVLRGGVNEHLGAVKPQGLGRLLVQFVPIELSGTTLVLDCCVRCRNVVLSEKCQLKRTTRRSKNLVKEFQQS